MKKSELVIGEEQVRKSKEEGKWMFLNIYTYASVFTKLFKYNNQVNCQKENKEN